MYGAIELGGTSIRCAISRQQNTIAESTVFPTTEPKRAVKHICQFFKNNATPSESIKSIGIASFGPIDINPRSAHFGKFLKTPKQAWSHFGLLNALSEELHTPMALSTDVNAALLAEHQLGAARGINNAVYVTVGTGIGAGIMVNGQFANSFMHPEIGHMRIPHNNEAGICPFHGACLEGLASGPAIAARAGQQTENLDVQDPIWESVADNLADMCNNLIVILACERIVLGGGVLQHPNLRSMIRDKVASKLNDYLLLTREDLNDFIVAPQIKEGSGLVGALLMAQQLTEDY